LKAAQRADSERGQKPDGGADKEHREEDERAGQAPGGGGAHPGGNEGRAEIETREEAEGERDGRAEAVRGANLIEARIAFIRRLAA